MFQERVGLLILPSTNVMSGDRYLPKRGQYCHMVPIERRQLGSPIMDVDE